MAVTGTFSSMPRIRQLPPAVITKIAAGEVIERPASVVKELLENSVDAGSTRIDIEVDQGGTERICVVDDGCGIAAEDLPLAFASHATSKLESADDLFRIGTLGFRGEALASIGGVAQVTLQSRPGGADCGAEISCHGGQLSDCRDWNGACGTRIEVRHLFFNTPVRRKFLRTVSTEMGHVSEMFTRLALAQPRLQLTLRHNGKDVYQVAAAAGLLDRLCLFFGSDLRPQLYWLDVRHGPARLFGYIANPACERGTSKLQYLFLNGRWIRDRSLGHALQEAYRGLLLTGRYAVAFLFLQLPPELVDVNVHPTKCEVRFRDPQPIFHLVLSAVRDRLRQENLVPRLQVPIRAPRFEAPPAGAPDEPRPWHLAAPPPAPPTLPFAGPAGPPPTTADRVRPAIPTAPPQVPPGAGEPEGLPAAAGRPDGPDNGTPVPLKALQLYDSYLVLETPEGMLVIDQHALHERILFEQFRARVREGTLPVQRLLIPEPVDLTSDQAARVLEHQQALAELGLDVEDFGGGTVLVTSYPALLGRRTPGSILRAVVDHLVRQEQPPSREQLFNDLLSLMACHAAVRAGDRLTPEEMEALLAQRELVGDTHHCPHGRPTSLLFSRHDLERQFRRI
jgi:DNA mismatch repair protein MutL